MRKTTWTEGQDLGEGHKLLRGAVQYENNGVYPIMSPRFEKPIGYVKNIRRITQNSLSFAGDVKFHIPFTMEEDEFELSAVFQATTYGDSFDIAMARLREFYLELKPAVPVEKKTSVTDELIEQLEKSIESLDVSIRYTESLAANRGISPYDVVDSQNHPFLAPLIVSKAQAYILLARLRKL